MSRRANVLVVVVAIVFASVGFGQDRLVPESAVLRLPSRTFPLSGSPLRHRVGCRSEE
jgi:hypothetical protein